MKANVSFRAPIETADGKQTNGRRLVIPANQAENLPDVIEMTAKMCAHAGREFIGRYSCLTSDGNRYVGGDNAVVIYYALSSIEESVEFETLKS